MSHFRVLHILSLAIFCVPRNSCLITVIKAVIFQDFVPAQVSHTGINNCIPQNIAGCDYLSLPEIHASGSFVAPQQPLIVTMSNDSYTTLDAATINSMFICGGVTPSALNAILFVTVICPRRIMVETHRYVYIYQELSSYLQLLELEVEDSKWRA